MGSTSVWELFLPECSCSFTASVRYLCHSLSVCKEDRTRCSPMKKSTTEYSAALSMHLWLMLPIVPSLVKIGGIVSAKSLFVSCAHDLPYN